MEQEMCVLIYNIGDSMDDSAATIVSLIVI